MEGKVVRWINSFGFIKARDGQQYFAHYSAIEGDGYRELEPGQRVSFDVAESERGPLAKRIKVIEAPCA